MRHKATFSVSTRGQHHVRKGIERQDSSGDRYIEDADSYAIAVADGHGDPSCPRSAVGSAFAVEIALERMSELARALCGRTAVREEKRPPLDLTRLTDAIVSAWGRRVAEDYDANPIPDLEERLPQGDLLAAKAAHEHLYGTTLVAALLMPHACVLVQQGDGCCTVVFDDGSVLQDEEVIAADELCVGNQTTSLSDAEAASEIRSVLIDYEQEDRCVAACLVGTDGIDKSLPPDGGVADFMLALALNRASARDATTWQAELEQHVADLSAQGSGDDASVAGYVDGRRLKRIERSLSASRARYSRLSQLSALRDKRRSMQRKAVYYRSPAGEEKVDEAERLRYLSEYDEISRSVEELERELGVEPELLDVPAAMPAAPAEPTRAMPQAPGSGVSSGLARTTAAAEVASPVSYRGRGDARAHEPAPAKGQPSWRRYVLPTAVGISALCVIGGIVFVLTRPAPSTPASESVSVASSQVAEGETKEQPFSDAELEAFLSQEVGETLRKDVLGTDERVQSLEAAGVNLRSLEEALGRATTSEIVKGMGTPEDGGVSLRLRYTGPDVGAVLDDAVAALDAGSDETEPYSWDADGFGGKSQTLDTEGDSFGSEEQGYQGEEHPADELSSAALSGAEHPEEEHTAETGSGDGAQDVIDAAARALRRGDTSSWEIVHATKYVELTISQRGDDPYLRFRERDKIANALSELLALRSASYGSSDALRRERAWTR